MTDVLGRPHAPDRLRVVYPTCKALLLAQMNPEVNPTKCLEARQNQLTPLSSVEMGRFGEGRVRNREGSAALLIVLILVLASACAYLLMSSADQTGVLPPSNAGLPPTIAAGGTPQDSGASKVMTAPSADSFHAEKRTGQGPSPAQNTNRFDGSGTLRGFIQTTQEIPFPETWTLVIEPSSMLIGSKEAVTKRIEITGGSDEFEVKDLPLAGYSLHGEAPGLNGSEVNVLLERTSPSAYVSLNLSPSGFIVGSLVDHEGAPLEGILIWLAEKGGAALATSQTGARQTQTDADGTWRFPNVLDGPYTLTYGSLEAPLVPPSSLTFRAPSLTVPAPELPLFATLTVTVVDDTGIPVAGARVRGTGSQGSAIDAMTTSNGEAILRNLTPGRYRLRANHDVYGEGFVQRRFEGGENQQVLLPLTRSL